eukprot:6171872-Pleurochrysis_carterae.AAC.2
MIECRGKPPFPANTHQALFHSAHASVLARSRRRAAAAEGLARSPRPAGLGERRVHAGQTAPLQPFVGR